MIEDKYIGKLDAQDKRWYDYILYNKHKGNEIGALEEILKDLDCTRIYPDGSRPVQTINYGYRTDIAGFIYIYNILCKNNPEYKDIDYYAKLVNRHEQNLSFEENNPPIIYHRKQSRTSSRSVIRTAKTKDIFTGEERTVDVGINNVVKERNNAAIRKAKALNDRTVNFAFNNFKVSK